MHAKKMRHKNTQYALVALSVTFFVCFGAVAYLISRFGFPFDSAVQVFALSVRSAVLTSCMLFVTNLASPLVLYLFTLTMYVVLVAKNRIYEAFVFICAMGVGVIAFSATKHIFDIARPLIRMTDASGPSFPSGHMTMATIAFLLTLYFFKGYVKNYIARTIFVSMWWVLIALIGISRIYLGAHFLSDVVGGFCLGLGISYIAVFFSHTFGHLHTHHAHSSHSGRKR